MRLPWFKKRQKNEKGEMTMKKFILPAIIMACLVCFSLGCDGGKKRAEAERAAAEERARFDREVQAAIRKADAKWEASGEAARHRAVIRSIWAGLPSDD